MNRGHGGGRATRWTALSILVPTVVAGAVAGVLAGIVGLFALFGEARLLQVAELAVLAAVLAAGTTAGVWWVVRVRPGVVASCVVLGPFAVGWALFVPWYRLRFPIVYIGWSTLALVALAVLSVWFWRTSVRTPRRAIVYLCGMLAVVALNGIGVAGAVWRNTNALGLRGQPAPWTAFDTLTSASCLSGNRFHRRGAKLVEARCPSGPDADYYAGAYDTSEFDNALCSGQPREAFAKWWEWNRKYRIEFTLEFAQGRTIVNGRDLRPPYPVEIGGSTATIVYTMRLSSVFRSDAPASNQARFSTATETWTVSLETVALGGWKVCKIDVSEPIVIE